MPSLSCKRIRIFSYLQTLKKRTEIPKKYSENFKVVFKKNLRLHLICVEIVKTTHAYLPIYILTCFRNIYLSFNGTTARVHFEWQNCSWPQQTKMPHSRIKIWTKWGAPIYMFCGQSYKQFTLVIYDSTVIIWGIFKSGTTLES